MAGGIGSRFWPLSRTSYPKQFIDIFGTGYSLLQQTYSRMQRICPKENILIVTHENYKKLVQEQLTGIPEENILLEPIRRNTAPCIAYATHKIAKRNKNARIIVAPSDHLIMMEDKYVEIVKEGLDFVSNNSNLLTLGITPNRPETGYGYIQIDTEDSSSKETIKKVKTFTEKPNIELAKIFCKSGEFLWNSGIFIWSVNTISKSFENHLAETDSLFKNIHDKLDTPEESKAVEQVYAQCKSISIDYGIMEKEKDVYVYAANFGWSDLGTWGSLYQHTNKDENRNGVAANNIKLYDTEECMVHINKNKTAVIQGLKDYIIVDTDDTLLICKKEEEQRIKEFVNDLNLEFGLEF